MRSKRDQPNQIKEKSKPRAAHTEKFIRQIGPQVEIGSFGDGDEIRSIKCQSWQTAQNLALTLSGTKIKKDKDKKSEYVKLHSHPWYGTVLLEELSDNDKNLIVLFIEEHSSLKEQNFKLKVHRLFIDDPNRPANHALIQEILLVLEFAEESHE